MVSTIIWSREQKRLQFKETLRTTVGRLFDLWQQLQAFNEGMKLTSVEPVFESGAVTPAGGAHFAGLEA